MQGMTAYAPAINATGTLPLPQGEGAVSIVDVRDIAAVAAAALTQPGHEGKAYEVTGPASLTGTDLARQISTAAGRPIRYADVSPEEFNAGLRQAGLPGWLADGLTELEQYYREGRAARISQAVVEATGKAPRSFAAWAAENADAFR